MKSQTCILLGAPVQDGAGRLGCEMGPSALRTAGLSAALSSLGHIVHDRGDIAPAPLRPLRHANPAIKSLPEIVAWTESIAAAAYAASAEGLPIFLGGDHSLSGGSITGVAQRAAENGRPFFVLWLDSHPDLHTLVSTTSGHLHGVQMAYCLGMEGFSEFYPAVPAPVRAEHVCMMGIRSVDEAEQPPLRQVGVRVFDMRAIDEHGVAPLLSTFLAQVAAVSGHLHVSLDVDFLDPDIAPGVGTTVPGGATFREAHLIMEMLHDSGLVGSLDLVELNPFLDERGRTALLLVDLVASLMGRRVLDRPTQSYRQTPDGV